MRKRAKKLEKLKKSEVGACRSHSVTRQVNLRSAKYSKEINYALIQLGEQKMIQLHTKWVGNHNLARQIFHNKWM